MSLRRRVSLIALVGALAAGVAGCQSPPVNTAAFAEASTPLIAGTLQVGNALTASAEGWDPTPDTVRFQWFANNDAIEGATSPSLELTYLHADQAITVSATAERAGFIPTSRTSAATSPIIPTFADVPTTGLFYYEILWMADSGITGGSLDGGLRTFHPLELVTRQEMAAFLYSAAGSPEFTAPATATFSDVPVGSPFSKEIEWLNAEGIANGNADGTFQPLEPVSRQAMAAFLYRTAGSPEFAPPPTATFIDMPVGGPFFIEIEWLTAEGVSTGYDNGDGTKSFRPVEPVTRQAMAAFLYRAFH